MRAASGRRGELRGLSPEAPMSAWLLDPYHVSGTTHRSSRMPVVSALHDPDPEDAQR